MIVFLIRLLCCIKSKYLVTVLESSSDLKLMWDFFSGLSWIDERICAKISYAPLFEGINELRFFSEIKVLRT